MSIEKLKSMGGNFVSRLGGADIYKQDQLSKLTPQQLAAYNQQKEMAKTAGMRELSARLSDAFGGRDITGRAAQRGQLIEQQKAKVNQQERQKSLKAYAQTNPQLAKMYELFGEKGLQQGYLKQQEDLENEQARTGQIKTYVDAGVGYEDAVLLAAGLTTADIKSLRKEETTSQKIIDNVNKEVENVEKETKYQDAYADLDEAFGPQDAFQETFINKPARFLLGADPAGATGAAIRSRNALNLEIKTILANDYTGRPSNLLLQEIEKIIPTGTATSEKDAFEKYTNILARTKSRGKNLEQGILSEITSNADKESYREQLFKTRELEKKLEAAVLSLKGKKKATLEPSEELPSGLGVPGKYAGLYTRDY
tara:strand:+ start:115 stop:1218 length:1104 start_codon:yes stop_codon:yes gene_type:complete